MVSLQSKSWMITAALVCLSVRPSVAADDVIVGPASPVVQLRNFQGRLMLDADTIERMVFGTDSKAGWNRIDSQVRQKIRELENRYELTDPMRDKLMLASRSDKQRFLKLLEELKQKSASIGADVNQFRDIQLEAANLRTRAHDMFGASSFFGKTSKTVLADAVKRNVSKGTDRATAASPAAVSVEANNGLRTRIQKANVAQAEQVPVQAVKAARVKRLVVRTSGPSANAADALVPANEGGN